MEGNKVCKSCGAALPAGVSEPHCDRCVLGLGDETAAPRDAVAATALAGVRGPGARPERRRRPRHVRPRPVGTWALVIAILAFYAAIKTTGTGDEFLTLDKWVKPEDTDWHGELWRFVTPIFAHFSRVHVGGNAVLLLLFGPQLEVLVGTQRFLAIFLVAGISGVIASFNFVDTVSAGSSGAIFGIFGGILAFLLTNRTSLKHLRSKDVALYALWIVILLALFSVIPGVDNWAHAGGLIGGALFGLLVAPRLPGLVPRPRLRYFGGGVLVLLVTVGLWHGQAYMAAMTAAQHAFMAADIPSARAAFQRATELRRHPVGALVGLARIEVREGNFAAAEASMLALRERDPNDVLVHAELAHIYREQGRAKDALIELEAIHQYRPEKTWVTARLGRAYLDNGDAKKAVDLLSELPEAFYKDDPLAEYFLGDALRRTGQIERGERHLRVYEDHQRQKVNKDRAPKSMNDLAWYLMEEGRSLDEALTLAMQAVDKDPANPFYLGTLGCIYYQLGRFKEAMERFEKALERHTSKADAGTDLYFAAMTAMKLNLPDIAKKYLKSAEEADPRNRYQAQARRVVNP